MKTPLFSVENTWLNTHYFWLAVMNAWLLLGVALPEDRSFDALVCFFVALIIYSLKV